MPTAHRTFRRLPALAALAAASITLASGPALAQGGWGGGWNGARGADPWGGDRWGTPGPGLSGEDAREGRVMVERFPATDSGGVLGHGAVTVSTAGETHGEAGDTASSPPDAAHAPPGSPPIAPEWRAPGYVSPREAAEFEAAVIDRLAKAGYDTAAPATNGGQMAELRITHSMLVPAEQRRSPVSGEMAVGASNHGSMMGLGINIDLSKPRSALISTTLALRIRDRATGRPLWEGRASIATREGSSHWTNQAIAARLAAALFDGFPTNGGAAGRR